MPRIMQQLKQDIGPPKSDARATNSGEAKCQTGCRQAVFTPPRDRTQEDSAFCSSCLRLLACGRDETAPGSRRWWTCRVGRSYWDASGNATYSKPSAPRAQGTSETYRRYAAHEMGGRCLVLEIRSTVCASPNDSARAVSALSLSLSIHVSVERKRDFIWRGPCPPFEQRLAWTKRCFHRWSNLSGWPARFLSINRAGVCEIWESLPGRPTQCTERIEEKKPSLKRALNFALQMLSHPQGIKKGGPR
jgi:hypothetical protein